MLHVLSSLRNNMIKRVVNLYGRLNVFRVTLWTHNANERNSLFFSPPTNNAKQPVPLRKLAEKEQSNYNSQIMTSSLQKCLNNVKVSEDENTGCLNFKQRVN